MTHKDLIKLIYSYKDEIDEAYRHQRDREFFSQNSDKLFDLGLFKKFGKRVILNKNYRNFVDNALNRANLFIEFRNYESDLSLLKKLKESYEITQKSFYKDEMLNLIEELFDKIDTQDRDIARLIDNLVAELDFDIDILINRSEAVLSELKELIKTTASVLKVLNVDIIGIDEEIDNHSKELLYNLESYITNIDNYCIRVADIIKMNRLKKAQNKKLKKLAKLIYEDRDEVLLDYLKFNHNKLAFKNSKITTLANTQNEKIQLKVTKRVKEELNIKPEIKEYKKAKIGKIKFEPVIYIDLEKIINNLNENGSEDLFEFIKNHDEFLNYANDKNFDEIEIIEEAFKNFLTIIIPKNRNLNITNRYNKNNIRIVEWRI